MLLRLLPIVFILSACCASGCTSTGHSIGMASGVDTHGNSVYHAPHFTHQSEKLDVQLQYYRFKERDDSDYLKIDWKIKY